MNAVMKKGVVSLAMACMLATTAPLALAQGKTNTITGKSVLAGALSLIVWPGIGQAVNSNKSDKVVTHAVIGLLPPFRFWSGWDALVRREGGYWHGRI